MSPASPPVLAYGIIKELPHHDHVLGIHCGYFVGPFEFHSGAMVINPSARMVGSVAERWSSWGRRRSGSSPVRTRIVHHLWSIWNGRVGGWGFPVVGLPFIAGWSLSMDTCPFMMCDTRRGSFGLVVSYNHKLVTVVVNINAAVNVPKMIILLFCWAAALVWLWSELKQPASGRLKLHVCCGPVAIVCPGSMGF